MEKGAHLEGRTIESFRYFTGVFKEAARRYYQCDGEMDMRMGGWRVGVILDVLRFAGQAYLWDALYDTRFSIAKLDKFARWLKADEYRELMGFLYDVSDRLESKSHMDKEDTSYHIAIYNALIRSISKFLGSNGLRGIPISAVKRLVEAFDTLRRTVQQSKLGEQPWPDITYTVFDWAKDTDNWIKSGDRRLSIENANKVASVLEREDRKLMTPFFSIAAVMQQRLDNGRHAYNAIMSTFLNF